MCIGDWRLGRLIRTVVTPYSIAIAGTIVIPRSQQRVGIGFGFVGGSATLTNQITIQISGSNAFTVDINKSVIRFNLANDGDLSFNQFTLSNGGAATANGCYWEQFLPDDYLVAGLDQFKSQYLLK